MAFDLNSPTVIPHLKTRIQAEEANLRGLETYRRGARLLRWGGYLTVAAAVPSLLWGSRNLAGWLMAYGLLAVVTHYLFGPLLDHYTQSAGDELVSLRDNLKLAQERQQESP